MNQPELKQERDDKKTYMKYTDEQIDLFIDLIDAGSDIKSACASAGIVLSIKRMEKIPAGRNRDKVIKQRKTEVEKWIADDDIDLQRN